MKRLKILLLSFLLINNYVLFAQDTETYSFSKTLEGDFEEVTQKVKAELKKQGFGVVTEIDMHTMLKEKLPDKEIKPYRILGVCNPGFAYQTMQIEENIGLFLPCKTLIKDLGNGSIEVVIVNPSVLMTLLDNEKLVGVADQVTEKFKEALDQL